MSAWSQVRVPDELTHTQFAGSDLAPSPACLCAAVTGEVFVGVDKNGSLGKGAGKGYILRLKDTDQDGKADEHTVFANVDNPRGLIAMGNQVYVLHTVIPESTGILEAMHLSVFTDADWDGVADGEPKRLISDISVPKHNQDRGADHTTNGIRMGIDGWIYIAVGDFGIVGAKGADGTELTMLGGGIVRVRPDGTEMEVYTHGLRNIYDVAIDPFMNIFTRGNTNDGGGWNIRFIHQIQSGEYGYPVLFKRFTDEIIPALVDVGGGSGTGAMFFEEQGWPEKYNNQPMMCDWGRSQLFIHRVTPDGPSFTQEEEDFIRLSQITDVDSDGAGRLYLAAWDGAGFQGSPDKGFVEVVTPKDWVYLDIPRLNTLSDDELVHMLKIPSGSIRLAAQQEILARSAQNLGPALFNLARTRNLALSSRVAAIFTLKQLIGARANPALASLASDPALTEFALRAMTDRKSELRNVPAQLYVDTLQSSDPRAQVSAAVGLGRLGLKATASSLLAVANPPVVAAEEEQELVKTAFESEVVQGKKMVNVSVNIQGFEKIYLVIDDGGDGTGNDHGSWFEPTITLEGGDLVRLTDLNWLSAEQGWGQTLKNQDCTAKPLKDATGASVEFGIGSHSTSVIVFEAPKGALSFQAKGGISSSAGGNGSVRFIVASGVPDSVQPDEGPHATPNPDVILPHIAVRALVKLHPVDELLEAVSGPNYRGALWAMKYMHDARIVEGLVDRYESTESAEVKSAMQDTLFRLYHREAAYDGSWWWGTRPDTRGPYYKTELWAGSDLIADWARSEWVFGSEAEKKSLKKYALKNRVEIEGIEWAPAEEVSNDSKSEPSVDLKSITGAEGEIGKMAIEDVLVQVSEKKGNAARGRELFNAQGCIACHTIDKGQALKGPFMGHIGSIMKRDQIAESILKPNASISQGFATTQVNTKTGEIRIGFVSRETADELEMRDIAGQVFELKKSDIKSRKELDMSMMPEGLVNGLSIQDFASLLSFLETQKQ